MSASLLDIYHGAASGRFPPADGAVTLLPRPSGTAHAAIFATTAHHVIAADVSDAWLANTLGPELAAAMSPGFIVALEHELGLHADSVDVLLAAPGLGGRSALVETDAQHTRVGRALRSRRDVRVFTQGEGDAIVALGRGAAERWEIALEVDVAGRAQGVGRKALGEARRLVPAGEPLFAQIAPGNAAALRVALAADFKPIGGEVLFFPHVVGD